MSCELFDRRFGERMVPELRQDLQRSGDGVRSVEHRSEGFVRRLDARREDAGVTPRSAEDPSQIDNEPVAVLGQSLGPIDVRDDPRSEERRVGKECRL